MRPPGPVERVRARFAAVADPRSVAALPDGYQRLGDAVLLRLPSSLEGWYPTLGPIYREELDAACVYRVDGAVFGERRHPRLAVLAGTPGPVEVRENGIRYRLDPREIMFASGNRTERGRIGRVVRPGETVIDLFAGIGYFSLPAAAVGGARRVLACEINPVAFEYLRSNISLNRVDAHVEAILGDNRQIDLPEGVADRVLLGLLPSSLPFVGRAVPLLRSEGGWLHVHLIAGTREPLEAVLESVRRTVLEAGARSDAATIREVKPYGPGRRHLVADVRAVPRA